MKPQFLVLEQVEGFVRHPHKKWIFKTCVASGYILVGQKVLDIHEVCPTHRPRWIAIFRHIDCNLKSPVHLEIPKPAINSNPSPLQFGAVLAFDQAVDDRLFLSPQALDTLSDISLLPDHKKALVSSRASRPEILASRRGSQLDTTPTFMASYGHQHLLALKHLRIKGCLTHLLQPIQGPPRHWHPIEVFLLHLGLGGFFIDPDWELAYRFLGNQISTVHALAALVPVFNLLPFGPAELILDDVLQNAIDSRITVFNMRQIPVANGIMLIHQDSACEHFNSEVDKAVKEMIQHGIQPFPDDRFWDLTGFHSLDELFNSAIIPSPVSMPSEPEIDTSFISPTIAFVPVLPVKLKCLDGDHQCWTYADVTSSDLIGLWEGAFDLKESEHGEFILTPGPGGSHVSCQSALVTMRDGRITISACHDCKLSLDKLGFDGEIVFDQFGILVDGASIFTAVFLSTVPLQSGSIQLCLEQVIHATHQCQIAVSYLPETDKIAIDLQGDHQAINLIKSAFVHTFASQALKMLGRVCHVSDTLITFCACASIDAAPPAAFRIAGVVCLVRMLMDNLRSESGKIVTFKWLNRVLWEGPLPAQLSLE